MSGWICLHRKLLKWEWYDDINTSRLFIHCLLRANHTAKKWQGIYIPSGSFISGRKVLAKETGLTEQQVRTSLNKLKSTNDITIESTNKNSLITLMNWESYQTKPEQQPAKTPTDNQRITNKQPTGNQRITTNNNVNNDNNVNNKDKPQRFAKPLLNELEDYKKEKQLNFDPQSFLDHYDSNGWKVGRNSMKDWKATARNWSKNSTGFSQPTKSTYKDFPA